MQLQGKQCQVTSARVCSLRRNRWHCGLNIASDQIQCSWTDQRIQYRLVDDDRAEEDVRDSAAVTLLVFCKAYSAVLSAFVPHACHMALSSLRLTFHDSILTLEQPNDSYVWLLLVTVTQLYIKWLVRDSYRSNLYISWLGIGTRWLFYLTRTTLWNTIKEPRIPTPRP